MHASRPTSASPSRMALVGAPNRWVIKDPSGGYHDGLSGAELAWQNGTFALTAKRAKIAGVFTKDAKPTDERRLTVALRTVRFPDAALVLGTALEGAWRHLTGAPPSTVWKILHAAGVEPASRRPDLALVPHRPGPGHHRGGLLPHRHQTRPSAVRARVPRARHPRTWAAPPTPSRRTTLPRNLHITGRDPTFASFGLARQMAIHGVTEDRGADE